MSIAPFANFVSSFITFNSHVWYCFPWFKSSANGFYIKFSIGWFSLLNSVYYLELKESMYITHFTVFFVIDFSLRVIFIAKISPVFKEASSSKTHLLVEFKNTTANPTFFPLVLVSSMFTAFLYVSPHIVGNISFYIVLEIFLAFLAFLVFWRWLI